MSTLIIDNYDSFTYNLVQCVGQLGSEPRVFRNDAISVAEIALLAPSHIIISPGPGRPADGGISGEVVRTFGFEIPTLGVCLGHQIIAHELGARICRAPLPVHGKSSHVFHCGTGPWRGIPSPFEAGRYHSLMVAPDSLPADLVLSAWTDCGLVMGFQHSKFPLIGVQFHPESILTSQGTKLLQNFLSLGAVRTMENPS